MSDDKKPVDLAAIRARIANLQGGNKEASTVMFHDAPAMADEIERLRDGILWALRETDIEALGPCLELRRLLPPS